ncbi:MAG: AAA family ATPase [Deltaproteobacteria bacterium]
MDCHCSDHVPGEWHKDRECDCASHDHPTFSFVVTKVMEEDPGSPTVYVSQDFMEKLGLEEDDPVEIVDSGGHVVQAKSHPNPWVETRMISLDASTMDKIGCRLFGQVKLRKTTCEESRRLTLEVPPGANVTRRQLQTMVDRARGSIISGQDHITLARGRGEDVRFRVVACQPEGPSRISRCTVIELVGSDGQEYVSTTETTFNDVGGLDEAVRKVREVVQLPLQHPEIFHQLGIDPPRGVLLHGPSGTGKTLIAKAVAGETGCYFKAISGTEIMDKYYGESEAKLRAAFEEAYNNAPAIIFIDEIDALAPRRDTAEGEVERRVTAQLLALMDGMEERGDVIVLAATNLPNVLDSALRRPGRFDREILIGVPDKAGRREILAIHTADMPLGDVDLLELAERTHGFVGADIRALCREAGYAALRRILPGLEDTAEQLTDDFLDEIRVESEDFDAVLKEMRPSSARDFEVDLQRAGWEHVSGYQAEIEVLQEMVLWPLQHVSFLSRIGVSHLTGIVITGPSGVGKSLMARSLAKESGFNVIEIRGSELISKYLGESERNIRELFQQARQMAPTVVILDGIDAMTSSGWSDSKVIDRVVNQLALEMNTITTAKPILVVAVCNRSEDLPSALRATGRFGTELPLRKPPLEDRAALFRMYLPTESIEIEGDLRTAAQAADGLTGADIEEVCRRVVLNAARAAVDRGATDETRLTVSDEDIVKMLDRWKLTAGVTDLP